MTMKPTIIERRVDRPTDTYSALTRALDCAVARADLDLVFVTDDYGMLVVGSSTHLDVHELAAVTPIIGRGRADADIKRAGKSRGFSVCELEVLGETLYVAAVGGDADHRSREIGVSAAAAERILAA